MVAAGQGLGPTQEKKAKDLGKLVNSFGKKLKAQTAVYYPFPPLKIEFYSYVVENS